VVETFNYPLLNIIGDFERTDFKDSTTSVLPKDYDVVKSVANSTFWS